MEPFLENAQRILEIARLGIEGGEECESNEDFALLIRPDGGLHFIMGSPVSIDGAASCDEVRTAYHVSRSPRGVRVEGRTYGKSCVLEHRNAARFLLRDQVLYDAPFSAAGSSEWPAAGSARPLTAGSARLLTAGSATPLAAGSSLAGS